MSLHRADSELVALNAHAATSSVPVSADLFKVIQTAQDIAAVTDGSFDITIRPLADLWGFIWKEYRFPSAAELTAALSKVNYRFIELDAATRSVQFSRPGVSIDLGGIAKGFAMDCASEKLRALGITSALLKAGGDVCVIGSPPGQKGWTIQLEDPNKRGRRKEIVLRDGALSTSGDYENFFILQGKRYAHILNPRTGLPVAGTRACTVIAPTCMESDAWATALFVLGPERSFEIFGSSKSFQFTPEEGTIKRSRLFPAF